MRVRNPNTGPYIVSWSMYSGKRFKQECHTWATAMHFMRGLLIDGAKNIQVEFA